VHVALPRGEPGVVLQDMMFEKRSATNGMPDHAAICSASVSETTLERA